MRIDNWLLTPAERGNPATILDRRHSDGLAWSAGNRVTPLIHGQAYFAELLARVPAMGAGDLLLFTDWRGDADERMTAHGPEAAGLFGDAARRGVCVRALVWRSHLDRIGFSGKQNRRLGAEVDAAGGECLLDTRVRRGGSHHMKMVVLRHRDRPADDVAFVGGIDLCHCRRDTVAHHGDPQPMTMPPAYGATPPWHDIQAMIQGPAVGDAEAVFRERWNDPQPVTASPVGRLQDLLTRVSDDPRQLPAQAADPAPCGTHAVQLLRTYPYRWPRYPFAPDGERSIARGYLKVLPRARSLVYLEDQYLWSAEVFQALAAALRQNSGLRVIAIIPQLPDQDGRILKPANLVARVAALELLYQAGGGRVAVYSIENEAAVPIYVHAKACIVDDTWAIIGSDNFSLRSWTHDSELSCAVLDQAASPVPAGAHGAPGSELHQGAGTFAGQLRAVLCHEHLGGGGGQAGGAGSGDLAATDPGGPAVPDFLDPDATFDAFRQSAARLDAWHDGRRSGPRPPGRLRSYPTPQLSAWTRTWSFALYRILFDPDGRPRAMRRAGAF